MEHDPYESLRVPGYVPYLAGGVLSSIGAEIQAVAVLAEIWDRTGDYQLMGFTGLAQFLPVLLLSLPAGQAADHFNRRTMYQVGLALAIIASVSLAWLSWTVGPIWLIFAMLVLAGCGRAIVAPARVALVAQIVPLTSLPNAVTWNSTGWQIANVSGPALGGLILWLAGNYWTAYVVSVACAAACVGLLLLVQPNRPFSNPTPRTLANVFAGLRFVWRSELLLAAISLDLFAVLLGGATSLLPAYAGERMLNIGKLGFGLMRAAPAAGALCMALVMAHRPPLRRPGLALIIAVALFGVCTIVFGISRSPELSFAMLFLLGAFDNISVVVRGTLMQVLTPDVMRGRVAAVNTIFISSSNELGSYESGQVAAWFGPVFSVVSGGVGTIVVVILTTVLARRLATLGPLHELRAESSSDAPTQIQPASDP